MTLRHARLAAALAPALLAELRRLVPQGGRVLELGSGTGELAVYAAPRLPGVLWQPSDPDPASRASIAGWTERAGARNVLPPLALDLFAAAWRLQPCDAVLVVNVLHTARPGAAEALLAGAAAALPPGAPLVVVGPVAPPHDGPLRELTAGAVRHGFAVEADAPLEPGCRLVALAR